MTLNTIALELVPPNLEGGKERAIEDARKVVQYSAASGLDGRIRHVMMPGMIAEDDDRPIPMQRSWMYSISGRSSNRSWRESMACVRR